MSSVKVERYEDRGFFLTLPFPGDENPTLLYVADQDFETLKDLVEGGDPEWIEVRDELQELLDHSGHDEDHTFDEELIEEIVEVLDAEPRPESTTIGDPLEDDFSP